MFHTSNLIALAVFALSVVAIPAVQVRDSPSVGIPFTLRLNITGSTLPQIDRARVANFKSGNSKLNGRQSSFGVTDSAISYVTDVSVGSPTTTYSLLIDTGSSNTWVGTSKAYVETSMSVNTGEDVIVTYGSGLFLGIEFIDTVMLSSSLVITGQSIGVASFSSGFDNDMDGILGIGPLDLTEGTVSGISTVPTVTDNLLSQGKIPAEIIGISFAPTQSGSTANGELTFGGTDSSKFTGSIAFTPILSTYPASKFWGIDESITYGTAGTSVLTSTAGIVDTGTTLVLIASDAFTRYTSLTRATEDEETGLLRIAPADYANLPSLFFKIGSTSYELTKNAQTWLHASNTAIGGTSSSIYLIVADIGTPSGEGLDFINGFSFLERFYSVFDATNNRVGFATTLDTYSTIN